MKVNRPIHTSGLWVTEVVTYTHYAMAFILHSVHAFSHLVTKISDKMLHKTLKHPLPQSLVHIINAA